ncbi:NACHT domain-containing protein [Tengunoibacter tsumagoiensis]|uniref:HTH cro/C1-type domain-containing protein n=1 Tax=Tengunoibacter tsumagoiensis TaxID=2014871 RepID=A0A402A9M4_9CHLR|nr:NACHT domain-containing protein [Tengunoibacter tsumagoiensis]GCE15829.1 hypothetical protein KTT_56880 [Tengunoibacter tsumagoiensis]
MQRGPIWSQKIKRERLRHNWSQSDFARRLDTNTKTVGRWERGQAYPTPYYRLKICTLFNMTGDQLGFVEDDPVLTEVSGTLTEQFENTYWDEKVALEQLYGRTTESAQLEQWLLDPKTRIIAVLGKGGIGKTLLSATIVEKVESQFEYVFWHSLRNAPPLKEVLQKLVRLLTKNQITELPNDTDAQIALLLEQLKKVRCLFIFDNMESILQEENEEGQWLKGQEGYGKLLRRTAEVPHQSCLLLTSRERPREIENPTQKEIHLLKLEGLAEADAKAILNILNISGTASEEAELIHLYTGNPFAIKLVSGTIQGLFNGSITRFLKEGTLVFGTVKTLLESQFSRLSAAEQEILYWLAIEREPVTLEVLKKNIPLRTSADIMRTLESLLRHFMIEVSNESLGLQPVIMEYVTSVIIHSALQELETENLNILSQYALMKVQAKNYIRESQTRLLIDPIAQRLLGQLEKQEIAARFQHLIETMRNARQRKNYAAGNLLNILIHLDCDLRGYDFSRLYLRQAYLIGKFLPEVNFSFSTFESSVFTDTFGSVLSIAFNPSGKLMATGANNCEVRIWNVAEGVPMHILQGHAHWIWSVAISPDGKTVVSGSEDQSLRFWDMNQGRCYATLEAHVGSISSVAFNHSGSLLAVAGENPIIRLLDVQNRSFSASFTGHTAWIRAATFSPDGTLLASCSDDQTIRIWDVKSGSCQAILKEHFKGTKTVAFHPNGIMLASGSEDQTIRLWDIQQKICLAVLYGHTGIVTSIAFNTDGSLLVSGSEDQTAIIWDTRLYSHLNTLTGCTNPIQTVIFSPNGEHIITGSEDQTIRWWDRKTGQCINTLQGYTNGALSVAFDRQGQHLASGSEDKILRLWKTQKLQYPFMLNGHTNWIWSVTFSPDGQFIATGSEDQTIRLWETQTHHCQSILYGHTGRVGSVCFSPDGKLLVSGSNDQTIRIWDIATTKCLFTLTGHTNRIESIAFSPDGMYILSGSEDKTMRLWQADNGTCISTFAGHSDRVRSVAFHPTNNLIISGSYDHDLRIWDRYTRQCLQVIQGILIKYARSCIALMGR